MLSTLKLFEKHNLDCHIDSIGSTITGWVRNPAFPAHRVVVELVANGDVVAETVADVFRQDLLDAGKGDGTCGFSLSLPSHLQALDRLKIKLREKGKTIPFFKSQLLLQKTGTSEDYQCHIDQEGVEFVGWVRTPSAPTRRVVVELVANGDVVAETVADVFRQDLLDAGKGDGACGFGLSLPRHLRALDHLEAVLREKGHDTPFYKTTLSLADTRDGAECQFHIDKEETEIAGWVLDLSAPLHRVVVELLANGNVVAETVADMFRQDLLEAGKGDGACGFKLSFPDSLCDGHSYTLALRAKGAKESFYEFGPRRLGEPSCVFESMSPFEISGTCRLPKGSSTGIDIQAMIAGESLARTTTDRLNQFSLHAEATSVETLFSEIEPGSDRTLALEVQANGVTVCRVEKTVVLSRSGTHAILLETLTQERLELQLYEFNTTPIDRMTIQVGERQVWESATGPLHKIRLDFRSLCLSDGVHEVRLLSHSAANGEFVEAVWEIDFARWDVAVEIDSNSVVGTITDSWESNQNPAVEFLIDDHACGVATAKLIPQNDKRQFGVTFPIAARFRDGQPHRVSLRVVGTDSHWPERGALFKAGCPETQTLARVECLKSTGHVESHHQQVSGFVVAAWDPDAVFEVSLVQEGNVLARQTADQYSPQLDAEHVLPKARGFRFDVPEPGAGEYAGPLEIVASLRGRKVLERVVSFTSNAPFTVSDPGCGRQGICIVIGDPYASLESLEEARALLLVAANLKRATDTDVTVVLAYPEAESKRGICIGDWITDLVGNHNAQVLSHVQFVYLPCPVLPSTVFGAQEVAYRLDLWVRSCAFASVLGPSGTGVMAYCGNSRREGLLPDTTQVVVLLEGFSVEALLNGEHLLDDPSLLNTEALERLALRTADALFVHRPQALSVATGLCLNAPQKTHTLSSEIGPVSARPLGRLPDTQTSWFVVAGPMSTASGVGVVCDALDRLAREVSAKGNTIGIAFLGPEGDLRGKQAGDYIRARSQTWPFELRLHLDLSFDSMRDALADFSGRGLGLVLEGHEGSVWEALLHAVGVGIIDLSGKEQSNPTALADCLKQTLDSPEVPQAQPGTRPSISEYLETFLIRAEEDVSPTNGNAVPSSLPPISVCISHFNRPTLLRQTCESLRACGYPELEVVIVDDGSRAFGVFSELDEIQKEFSDLCVNVIKQPNSYLGAARNTAVRHANYDLIVFMDDDNIARPNMLHGFVEAMHTADADIVTARFAFFDETDVVDEAAVIPARLGVPLTPDLGIGVFSNGFGDANMMVRRNAFEQVGGFTEDYGVGHEDWEFFARARMNGLSHCLSNRVLFHYRVGAESMLRGRERMERDMLRNMRAYAETPGTSEQSVELYRVALLAQGLIKRWDQPTNARLPVARSGLEVARRLAFGRVAVIMRTKDRPVLLERAIDSVLGQTMTDWTLVIVNDGGDPAPVKALLDARKKQLQSRELLINNPTSTGMENASNAGITNSISEFVVIHDDDDAWDSDFLKRCVQRLDSTAPEVGGVVTHATVIVEDLEGDKVVERSRHLFKPMQSVDLAKMSVENQFPPISFLFRRSAMEQIGLFDGTLPVLGDWDFHLRMARRYQIDVIPEPLAYYHHRTAGTTNHYGNTVIAQKSVHQIQRAHYINRGMRAALDAPMDSTSGNLLYQGELHREVSEGISDIRHHLHWLEKMLTDRADHSAYLEKIIKRIDAKSNNT